MRIAVDWAHAQGSLDAEPEAPCLLLVKISGWGTAAEVSQKFFGWKGFAFMDPKDRKDLTVARGWEAFLQLPKWRSDMSKLVEGEKSLILANRMLQDGTLPLAMLDMVGGVKPLAFASIDALLADLQYILASVFTDPVTLWYSMRKAGHGMKIMRCLINTMMN